MIFTDLMLLFMILVIVSSTIALIRIRSSIDDLTAEIRKKNLADDETVKKPE